jgi:hypothetical protein
MNQAGHAKAVKRLRRRTGNTRVSSSPSKIPYGGFSPVRLQTGSRGIPPRPSQAATGLSARPASLRHPLTYTRLLFRSPKRVNNYRRGTCVQAALPSSDANLPVQRSLAPQQVLLSRRISAYYDLIRASRFHRTIYALFIRPSPLGLVWAGTEKFPTLSCLSVTTCRLLYPGSWMTALGCCFIIHASLPPKGRESASAISRIPAFTREPFNEAVKFAVAAARGLASLATGQGVYVRAFIS